MLAHIYELYKHGTDDPTCRAADKTQISRTDFWTQWKKVTVVCVTK